ncbi:hypothetical protein CDL15_Pgr004170 [Punica granatum]|uniref:Uncharacterized protein n=1 Tax=Punica granatum TaxID=22663 RepID=A0A218XG65_PUNGR|nr:hypothetical protein CDL15_Pgr004170 [Punica granatum]
MRKSSSAVHLIYESRDDYGASDLDAKEAFAEAHMIGSNLVASSTNVEHGERYIRKKLWKSSLFSCLKSAKKSNPRVQPAISENSIGELEVAQPIPVLLSGLFKLAQGR